MTRRILMLCTGGTIASVPGPQGLAPSEAFVPVLQAHLNAQGTRVAHGAAVVVRSFGTPIDSAEAEPADWWRMASAIRTQAAGPARFDGFVVLHGTDTMAFTASALAFALRGLPQPVAITGSMEPWGVDGSDAPANVALALNEVSAPGAAPGVRLCFAGRSLPGARARKVSAVCYQAFGTPKDEPPGQPATAWPAPPATAAALAGLPAFPPEPPATRVALVQVAPGLDAAVLQGVLAGQPQAAKGQPPHAVLLACYGTGTVPSLGGAMARFLAAARGQGVALAAITQAAHGGLRLGTYAAGGLLVQHGVASGHDMTLEAAYAKLHTLAALGLGAADIEHWFSRNLVGELTEGDI
jgi:L-asparaginase